MSHFNNTRDSFETHLQFMTAYNTMPQQQTNTVGLGALSMLDPLAQQRGGPAVREISKHVRNFM